AAFGALRWLQWDGALWLFFFFQAEDGIRDRNVTGVQTCALPISSCPAASLASERMKPPTREFVARSSVSTCQTEVEGWKSSPKRDRKSTRLNSSHVSISYAVFCLKKKITR